MDKETEAYIGGLLTGLVVMGVIMIVAMFALDFNGPAEHYFQNVCEYNNGEVKDDVCVVDGRVFEIKEKS